MRPKISGASQLTIDNAALFGTSVGGPSYAGPLLENFVTGDTIDLHNFSATGAALRYNPADGLLQITNGSGQVATLDFQNSTLGTGELQRLGRLRRHQYYAQLAERK